MKMVLFIIFGLIASCSVATQTPVSVITISFRHTDDGRAAILLLNDAAIREGLDFSTGAVAVNSGSRTVINAMVKDPEGCVVATANSSAAAGRAKIYFYECPKSRYAVLKEKFILEAKTRDWQITEDSHAKNQLGR